MKSENKMSKRFRIAVLGHSNVGKSALTVRYLTRRFIGEYHSNSDLLYRQTVNVQNSQLDVEIVDVSGETRDCEYPTDLVQWADVCILVYAVNDRHSFETAGRLLQRLSQERNNAEKPVFALLANKADLEHLREVSAQEGGETAGAHNCHFAELSVAENCDEVVRVFETLLVQCRSPRSPPAGAGGLLNKAPSFSSLSADSNVNKGFTIRRFSVSKMLSSLLQVPINHGNSSAKTATSGVNSTKGTVVVCQPADLYKNKLLQRRQHSLAL